MDRFMALRGRVNTRRAIGRWALVAATAVLACAIPTVLASLPVSGAEPGAGVLRQRIIDSAGQAYTGYVKTQAELGLPNLPQLSDVTSLLSGFTDIRVWYRSPSQNRVDVVNTLGERDVYQTPDGVYTWDYGTNLLTEIVGTEQVRLPRAGDFVPPDLARRVLALDPVDPVVSLPTRRIAGITAAGLRLRPTDPATTVGQVDIWADPATGLPLQVEVTARGGAKPIVVSQFVDLTRDNPSDATLSPPVDAAGVSLAAAPNVLSAINQLGRFPLPAQLAGQLLQPQIPGLPGVGRYGSGMSTFVALPIPDNVGESAQDTMTKAGATTIHMTRGHAVLIQIPLLSVMVVDLRFRTYLVAGFVDHTALQQAATELAQFRPAVRPAG
jgi:outer membrane lipoprotein-sorting protein